MKDKAARMREAQEAKEKLKQDRCANAWLIEGTMAAEKYYKNKLEHGLPPNAAEAAAAAVAAANAAHRAQFGDAALEVAREEEPPARSDQMDAAANMAVSAAPLALARGDM